MVEFYKNGDIDILLNVVDPNFSPQASYNKCRADGLEKTSQISHTGECYTEKRKTPIWLSQLWE